MCHRFKHTNADSFFKRRGRVTWVYNNVEIIKSYVRLITFVVALNEIRVRGQLDIGFECLNEHRSRSLIHWSGILGILEGYQLCLYPRIPVYWHILLLSLGLLYIGH